MSFKTTKIKWARKLLKAKMFVLMTDKEGVIAIDGADPHSFTDAIALAAQAAELQSFYGSLGELIKEHDIVLRNISKERDGKAKNQKTATIKGKTNAKSAPKTGKQPGRVSPGVRKAPRSAKK